MFDSCKFHFLGVDVKVLKYFSDEL